MKPIRAGGKGKMCVCVCVWRGGGGRTRPAALNLRPPADDGANRKDIIVVLFSLSVLPVCKERRKKRRKKHVHPELGETSESSFDTCSLPSERKRNRI